MSKEWKAPDKVTQKMTRDGAVAENLTTGETTSISERPQEENYSQAPTAAAEKAVDRIGAAKNPYFPLAVFRSGTGNAGIAEIYP